MRVAEVHERKHRLAGHLNGPKRAEAPSGAFRSGTNSWRVYAGGLSWGWGGLLAAPLLLCHPLLRATKYNWPPVDTWSGASSGSIRTLRRDRTGCSAPATGQTPVATIAAQASMVRKMCFRFTARQAPDLSGGKYCVHRNSVTLENDVPERHGVSHSASIGPGYKGRETKSRAHSRCATDEAATKKYSHRSGGRPLRSRRLVVARPVYLSAGAVQASGSRWF